MICFFFFNQKTAYEMRISDWSSDVCSSDLRDDAVDPFEIEPVVANMAPGSALLFLGSILHGAGANMSGAVRRAVIIGYCLGWQIGRASCRERVCQYV